MDQHDSSAVSAGIVDVQVRVFEQSVVCGDLSHVVFSRLIGAKPMFGRRWYFLPLVCPKRSKLLGVDSDPQSAQLGPRALIVELRSVGFLFDLFIDWQGKAQI